MKGAIQNPRLRAAFLAAGVLAAPSLPGAAIAAPVEAAASNYTFAFKDAAIGQVAEAILGKTLGLGYTVDPSITGTMSFQIDRRLTSSGLLEAFEVALRSSDIVMVRQGDSLLLEPRAKARGSGGMATASDGGAHGVGYRTQSIPLAYATPSEVARALTAIAPADTVVFVDDKQGLLILGGDPGELEAAVRMVHTLDHSGLEDAKIRYFELAQAASDTVASDLDKLLQAAAVSGVTIVPLKRLNGLFAFARTSQSLDQVRDWVARLDVPSKEINDSFYAYHPRNVAAEDLTDAVLSLLTGQSPRSAQPTQTSLLGTGGSNLLGGGNNGALATSGVPGGLANGFGARSTVQPQPSLSNGAAGSLGGADDAANGVRIGFDRGSNTVLVMAPEARWLQIRKLLEEIDHPPAQVMIEASILEVTLNNQTSGGIDWSFATSGANGSVSGSSINSASGTVGPSTPGLSLTFANAGQTLQAAVHALATKTTVVVISNPKIIATDNHIAQLEVGDQVPIITQSAQSTTTAGSPVIDSVSYANTGVILSVTPRISGDRINLDIQQEVSSVTSNTTSTINSPTIQQRMLETTLILDNGGLAAIGGLMSSTVTKNDSGTPLLKDIPGLGLLFKTAGRTTARTELVVLITAKIINEKTSPSRVMSDLLADMIEIERRGLIRK